MGLTNYGFFTNFRHEEQAQVAFLPCAPGCRGSSSDPRHCQCICRGINHGLLLRPVKIERPVPVPYRYNPSIPLQQLSELTPRLEEVKPKVETERLIFPVARGTGRIAKKIGKRIFAIRPSESELNENILLGLRKQFNQERVDAVIDQAYSFFFSQDQNRPRPELYELYETGILDNVLERRGIRWVLGRPKYKTGR